jgi:glycosyltransferase involved in cell wall biosynthesis
MTAPRLITVVPCYNEEAVLTDTHSKLSALYNQLVGNGQIAPDSAILYVDDGSRDATWDIIEALHKEEKYANGLKLAHNVGHQNALLAGLMVAKEQADVMVSIDADLQDDIHVIPEMLQKFQSGCDIVYGVRNKRTTDTWFKRTTALTFYRLMHWLGVSTVYNHADFRLMSKRAVDQLCQYRERNLFLRGLVPLIGYQTACVYYDRSERLAGESKYPFFKMLNFAIDGITSFSIKPVRMVFTLGLLFLVVALIILGYVLYSLLTHSVVPGWASIILSIWLVGACVLMGLGIVGEYIGKIYMEVKDRPRFNAEKLLDNVNSDESRYN